MPLSTSSTVWLIRGSGVAAELSVTKTLRMRPSNGRLRNALQLWFPVTWLTMVVLAALLAPHLPLIDPYEQDLGNMLATPGSNHIFGADSLGRDIFSRSVYAMRISLVAGLGSVAVGLLLGGLVGLIAGYYGGRLESVAMSVMNVVLAFPPLVLAIAITSAAGPPLAKVIIAIGVLFVPAFARIARANTLVFRNREFVVAAQASGMSDARVLSTEILPNLVSALLAYSLLMVAVAIVAEASLSFLGLSVAPPIPSLGSMVASEQRNVLDAPHAVFCPAAMLFLTVLALNLIGEHASRRLHVQEQLT
jgi:peptide/nickel transport system permease protein